MAAGFLLFMVKGSDFKLQNKHFKNNPTSSTFII